MLEENRRLRIIEMSFSLRLISSFLSRQWDAHSGLYGSVAPRAVGEVLRGEARGLCFQKLYWSRWSGLGVNTDATSKEPGYTHLTHHGAHC